METHDSFEPTMLKSMTVTIKDLLPSINILGGIPVIACLEEPLFIVKSHTGLANEEVLYKSIYLSNQYR